MGTTTKALKLLDEFSIDRPEIGLTDLHRRVGRDKATVHRHLSELESLGYVEQNPATRAYRLGPAVLRLATIRETCFPLRTAVAPIIDAAAADLGELVHFSLLQDDALAPIHHADPHVHGTAVYFDAGGLLPLHGTASGIAVLAFGPAALRDRVLNGPLDAYTETTPTDAETLRERIEAARDRGYSISERFFDPDVVSVALPVYGLLDDACGAIAVAAPAARADEARAVARLRDLAPLVSKALGGRAPEAQDA
ncbi:IclR family transcriptional regulator [Palleronia sp.]|uniref:IclR family transcriptional regulator n=1 Tax=Palleronia sp. TaxID=1940284 RepID=UPI0035C7CF02